MNEREAILRRAEAKDLIERYSAKLGLEDWRIRYWDWADDGDQASLNYRLNEKVAQIGVDPKLPASELETIIIHELVHLAIKPLTTMLENLISKQSSDAFRLYLTDEFEVNEEVVVEQITRALGGNRFKPYDDMLPKYGAWA